MSVFRAEPDGEQRAGVAEDGVANRRVDLGEVLCSERERAAVLAQLRHLACEGQEIAFTYDALNRQTLKVVPGYDGTNGVATTYDLLDRRLTAAFLEDYGVGPLAWTWDALGRPVTESQGILVIGSSYDLAGRRTGMTLPSGQGVSFEWDLADRMTLSWETGQSPTGAALFGAYAYDALGRRTALTRGNGASTSWTYVPDSRDWSMTHNLTGSADDVTYAFALNPAGQAVSRDVSNPAYQFAMPTQAATPYVRDGLNQYDAVNGVAFTHDLRGNLTSDGVTTWQFDAENKLQWVFGPALSTPTDNDPIGRLRTIHQNGVATVLLWDGPGNNHPGPHLYLARAMGTTPRSRSISAARSSEIGKCRPSVPQTSWNRSTARAASSRASASGRPALAAM